MTDRPQLGVDSREREGVSGVRRATINGGPRHRATASLSCSAFVVVVLTIPVSVAAQPTATEDARQQAQEHFELGVALMRNENWPAALAEFERSFELSATRSALFNRAMCLKALHRYRDALDAFDRWQAEYAADAREDERASVAAAVEELRAFLAVLNVTVAERGAAILLDGERVGTSPIPGPLTVEVGPHTVEVTLDGYETAQEDVTVTSGEHREITIDLVPAAVATPPETGAGQAAQGEPDGAAGLDPAWFWATASAAAAIGVAAAVTGGLTYTTFADFDAGGRHDQGLSDKGDALQVTTNVLAGVAGAAALAAVVLVFFTDFSEEQATAPEAGPAVAWWPGGIAVSW